MRVSAGERLWPEPPRCLDTVADGMRMQQLGHLTWPIILEHAEKDVYTIVRLALRFEPLQFKTPVNLYIFLGILFCYKKQMQI